MSTAVGNINPQTYSFVESIIKRFDSVECPMTEQSPLILDAGKDGGRRILDNGTAQTFGFRRMRLLVSKLPPEIAKPLVSNAENFSQWCVITGLLDPQIPKSPDIIEKYATEMLSRLAETRTNRPYSAQDQLLKYIFEQTLKTYTLEQQNTLIEQMSLCQHIMTSSEFEAQSVPAMAPIVISTSEITKVLKFLKHVFINSVIKVALAWLTFTLTKHFISRIFAFPISIYISAAVALIFFPLRIYDKIILFPIRIVLYTRQRTEGISEPNPSRPLESNPPTLEEQIGKAYKLWMYLMKNPQHLYLPR